MALFIFIGGLAALLFYIFTKKEGKRINNRVSPFEPVTPGPSFTKDLMRTARDYNWRIKNGSSLDGTYKGLDFTLEVTPSTWRLTLPPEFSSVPEFTLNQHEVSYLGATGDENFDQRFSVFCKDPAFMQLFLTPKNRITLRRYFSPFRQISFAYSGLFAEFIFEFLELHDDKSITPHAVRYALDMLIDLQGIKSDLSALEPLIFEGDDPGRQLACASAAFLSYYKKGHFKTLITRLLDHKNIYIKILSMMIFKGTLPESIPEIEFYADWLTQVYSAMGDKKHIELKPAVLVKLYPWISDSDEQKKIIRLSYTGKDKICESFLIYLLHEDLYESWLLEILENLKEWGSSDAVPGIKKFKEQCNDRVLEKAADKTITAILQRIDGGKLEGRLSMSDLPKNQGNLSVSDTEKS